MKVCFPFGHSDVFSSSHAKAVTFLLCLLLLCAVLLLCLLWWNPPEPERCALCDAYRRHAPSLVNLATGEVGELAIYEPHCTKFAEIAEEQPGGFLAFLPCAGQWAICDSSAQTAVVKITARSTWMDRQYFCRDCRMLLFPYSLDGYVLADLYVSREPKIYPVRDGTSCDMRCYSVTVSKDSSDNLTVSVQGTFG